MSMQAKTPWPHKWPALNSRINFHLLRLLAKLHDQREYCCLIAFLQFSNIRQPAAKPNHSRPSRQRYYRLDLRNSINSRAHVQNCSVTTNNLEPIRSAAWVINIIDPVSTAKVNPNILTDIPKRDIALKSILGHTPNSLRSIKTTLPNNIPMPQICKDSTVG